MVRVVDLSGTVEADQPVYPGNQRTQFWTTMTHEESGHTWSRTTGEETAAAKRKLRAKREGDDEEHPLVRSVLMSEHGPTHVDAPAHFDPTNDETIEQVPLERFYTDAVGVDCSHVDSSAYVTVEDLEAALDDTDLTLQDGDAITIHLGHRERNYRVDDHEKRYAYLYDHTGLTEDATRWLGERGVDNIGIDAPSVDHSDALSTKEYPAHDVCAEYGMLNVENMANLDAVVGRRFTLCAFPLKLRGGTGSPLRPVALL